MFPSTHHFVKHTHKYARPTISILLISELYELKTAPRAITNTLCTHLPAKSFCFRNETGQSSQPLSLKWIMCLLLKLGPISPFLHFLALCWVFVWFFSCFLFLLKIIDMVIHLRCTENLNLAPVLLVNYFLLAWDRVGLHFLRWIKQPSPCLAMVISRRSHF